MRHLILTRKLILAAAGAGKTHRIITESREKVERKRRVLVITYTNNNQHELRKRFGGNEDDKFTVKGLYSFLLEDIIRPYQRAIYSTRINGIDFTSSDPHKTKNGMNIPGTAELNADKSLNLRHFINLKKNNVYTTYISKLAVKLIKSLKGQPIDRIESIYTDIYIDEVQDLVGWDYELLKLISKSKKITITCVGDFRQSIYETSIASKTPKTNTQKVTSFNSMNFVTEHLAVSYRSNQEICDFSDLIHENEGFQPTISKAKETPNDDPEHIGIYIVPFSKLQLYINKYNPMVLTVSSLTKLPFSQNSPLRMNFGLSKGLTFERVLIIPTKKQIEFLIKGNSAFSKDKTDEAKNKLYVATTRAKFSVCFAIQNDDDFTAIENRKLTKTWCGTATQPHK